MAIFGSKKAKSSEGSDLALAYLEEAQRLRSTLVLLDPKGREIPASLVAITDERVTLSTQGKVLADKGDAVGILLFVDGLRLKVSSRALEVKPGTLVLDAPGSIELAERRKKARARLNPREGAAITALTGLFDGIGLTGSIENISEGGLCMKVSRAMNVKTQGPMHLGPNLVSVGDPFMLMKLTKLPKCPPIEVGGIVTHVAAEGGGLLMGIAFEAGKEALLSPVKALVASRASAIPSAVPPKARRLQEVEAPPDDAAVELAPIRPAPKREPEPPPPAPAPEPAVPVVSEAPLPPPDPTPDAAQDHPDPVGRGLALLRVKKRSRGILLAMPAGPDRQALEAFLLQDGYGRVKVAGTLTELLEQVEDVQLVFVDGGVAELQGLQLASLILQRLEGESLPVVLAEGFVDAELVLGAQELGVAQVLVKPYDLDGEFLHLLEGHLGIG